jgi:hypothetical protein
VHFESTNLVSHPPVRKNFIQKGGFGGRRYFQFEIDKWQLAIGIENKNGQWR